VTPGTTDEIGSPAASEMVNCGFVTAVRGGVHEPPDVQDPTMVYRKQLIDLLREPRTPSSLARELGLRRGEIDAELAHLIRSARAAGHRIAIEPAKCRSCGFTFDERNLSKPGKCPECRSTWLYEPLISIRTSS
jgi:transcriptional regulator